MESENQYRDSLQMVAENYVTIGKKTASVESDIRKIFANLETNFLGYLIRLTYVRDKQE